MQMYATFSQLILFYFTIAHLTNSDTCIHANAHIHTAIAQLNPIGLINVPETARIVAKSCVKDVAQMTAPLGRNFHQRSFVWAT